MTLELPSLEKIQEIDRQRLQAIEALQISKDYVKCQTCGTAVPPIRTLTTKEFVVKVSECVYCVN